MNIVDQSIRSNRASALFPLFDSAGVRNKLVFQDYWSFKNNQSVQAFVLTLRDGSGKIVDTRQLAMGDLRSHSVDIFELFELEAQGDGAFTHSVEAEVFFSEKPRFNYPAISVVYSHDGGIGMVHSCLRTTDEGEEFAPYIEELSQTGFDVFASQDSDTYLLMITGFTGERDLRLEFSGFSNGDIHDLTETIRSDSPMQMHAVNLSEMVRARNGDPGTVYKVNASINLGGVFPRYYVANVPRESGTAAPGLTHSFFDQSQERPETDEGSYLSSLPSGEMWQGGLTVPVFMDREQPVSTSLICYESNSLSSLEAELALFTEEGELLGTMALPGEGIDKMGRLDISASVSALIDKSGVDQALYCAGIRLRKRETRLPKRVKFGLNIFYPGREYAGTNICFTSSAIGSMDDLGKPFNTKWGPIGGTEDYKLLLQSFEFWKDDFGSADAGDETKSIEINLFNSAGDKTQFSRPFKSCRTFVISADDDEVDEFLKGEPGTAMCRIPAPFVGAWILSFKENAIGGDHAF